MKREKWMFLLVILLGTLFLIGCGGNGDKIPVPGTEQSQDKEAPKAEEPKAEAPKAEEPKAEAPKAEEPKAEAPKAEAPKAEEPKAEAPKAEAPKAEEPKAEAPKAEAPKAEAPKAEAPKAEAPKTSGPPALNLGHDLDDGHAKCSACHAGKAMLDPQPLHNIDASTPDCATCHKLNPKKA